MRVFVLCTGRSGSSTFIKACKHIDNFTADHESLASHFGKDRWNYPDNHIEADNRLSWHLGQLNKYYGDEPFFVHLKRDREQLAQSFLKRYYMPTSIIDSFCEGIRLTPVHTLSDTERLQACYDYIDTVDHNIEHFLADKSNVLTIHLESIEKDFLDFWERIDAIGNKEDALTQLKQRHNNSTKRKLNLGYRLKLLAANEWQHIKLCFK